MPTWKIVVAILGIFICLVWNRWERERQQDKAEAIRQAAIKRMEQDPKQAAEVDREATDFLGVNRQSDR